jgi:hypothetical protein
VRPDAPRRALRFVFDRAPGAANWTLTLPPIQAFDDNGSVATGVNHAKVSEASQKIRIRRRRGPLRVCVGRCEKDKCAGCWYECGSECGCRGPGGRRRRYRTRAEQPVELEACLEDLKLDVRAVEDRLSDLELKE